MSNLEDPVVESWAKEPGQTELGVSPEAKQAIAAEHQQAVMTTLRNKTLQVIAAFDAEDKGYAFNDGGDGTQYAEWMRDLLLVWLDTR